MNSLKKDTLAEGVIDKITHTVDTEPWEALTLNYIYLNEAIQSKYQRQSNDI